ncbi:hypothetical protein SUVZ_16G4630 [Saccharomyces uvarum]|uniref:Uncharacterized protein n=1 Tax=Saccharomyces uvarum TaxID=230603 RepID=A0ABN8WN48_SACUV|nr:hypothetical protein SUVZ_16G4630 [Saccharomyces uvarum]
MEDTKIEDEESVGLLSSKYLESQNIVLPKDVFRNFFTWFCYQFYKSLAFRVWLLLWLPLSAWWKLCSDPIPPFIATMVLITGLPLIPFILFVCHRRAFSKQLTQFCKEIIKNAPGIHIKDWELIVLNFNSYMYENKFWNNECFFFDVPRCYESFRKSILEPFSLKKDKNAKVKSFKESVPYIEEALEVYFAEVDKRLNQICSEKPLAANSFEDIPLPKQLYRLKFSWTIKTAMNLHCIEYVLLSLFSTYLIWIDNIFFRVCLIIVFSFDLTEIFNKSRVATMKMEDKRQFFLTIREQEIGANGWDQIAKRMNVYLFEQKVWKTEEFFFDGIDCKWFFDHNFSNPITSKRYISRLPLNAELWPYIKEAQLACEDESSA